MDKEFINSFFEHLKSCYSMCNENDFNENIVKNIIKIPDKLIKPNNFKSYGIYSNFEYNEINFKDIKKLKILKDYYMYFCVINGFIYIMKKYNTSIFDWNFIYIEKDYCYEDGAGILLNCNPKSNLYNRIVVYETLDNDDDSTYTLLNGRCNLEILYKEYENFKPIKNSKNIYENIDENYFICYMAKKYGLVVADSSCNLRIFNSETKYLYKKNILKNIFTKDLYNFILIF